MSLESRVLSGAQVQDECWCDGEKRGSERRDRGAEPDEFEER